MPRNGSGSYSLPEAPFVANTVISSTAVNSDLSDIGAALTGSLARDGQGGMTAALPLDQNGFNYVIDPNTGMYRTAADTQAIKCGGVDVLTATTTSIGVSVDLDVTGEIQSHGSPILPVGLGPLPWSRVAAPALWILVGKTYSRTTYADLWVVAQAEIALGNTFYTIGDGSTTFGVGLNMPGRVPACNDSISGSAAGVLTSATMTPNGSTLGSVNNVAPSETTTIATANLPAYTPTGAINNGLSVSVAVKEFNVSTVGGPGNALFDPNAGGGGVPTNLSGAFGGSISFAGNAQGGISTPIKNVQPTLITNYIIFAGV